jgi:hypothetical protein
VNNGADDNASGTTTLLVTAEELAGVRRRGLDVPLRVGRGRGCGAASGGPTIRRCRWPTRWATSTWTWSGATAGRRGHDASPTHEANARQRAVELARSQACADVECAAAGDDRVDSYCHGDHYNFAEKGVGGVLLQRPARTTTSPRATSKVDAPRSPR